MSAEMRKAHSASDALDKDNGISNQMANPVKKTT
jgi:hypothetical protein